MIGVIDSHIHIDTYCRSDQEQILNSLEKYKINGLISASNDLASLKNIMKISKNYSQIKPCAGYHPEQELPTKSELIKLTNYIKKHEKSIYGIGEVGLPFYIRKNNVNFNKQPYLELLEHFIILAKKLDKPLNLHAIYDDTKLVCNLLERHNYHQAHFHWYKTDVVTLDVMKEKGYFISITPDVFSKERTRQLIKYYPKELLLVETDGPWKYEHDKNNMTHPKIVYDIIEEIAQIKEESKIKIGEQILENTKVLYKI